MTRSRIAVRAALAVIASLFGIAFLSRYGDRLVFGRGPIVAAFALVRVAGVVAGVWTIAIVVTRAIATAADATTAITVVDRLTPAQLRRWLGASAAVGIGVVALSGSPANATTTSMATMHLLTDGESAAAKITTPVALPIVAPPPKPQAKPETWTVTAGDCLWCIATARVRAVKGDATSDAEVDRYLHALVQRNKNRLPRNHDLLPIGRVLELPPV